MEWVQVVDVHNEMTAQLVNLEHVTEMRPLSTHPEFTEMFLVTGLRITSNKSMKYWEELLVLKPANKAAADLNWRP